MNLQEVKAPNLKYNQLTITMNAEEHEVDMDQHQQHQNVETNSLVIKYVYDCESEQSIRQLLFSKNLDIVFFKMYNQWTMGSPAKCFICFRAVHDSISAKQLLDQFVPVDEQIVQNRVVSQIENHYSNDILSYLFFSLKKSFFCDFAKTFDAFFEFLFFLRSFEIDSNGIYLI